MGRNFLWSLILYWVYSDMTVICLWGSFFAKKIKFRKRSSKSIRTFVWFALDLFNVLFKIIIRVAYSHSQKYNLRYLFIYLRRDLLMTCKMFKRDGIEFYFFIFLNKIKWTRRMSYVNGFFLSDGYIRSYLKLFGLFQFEMYVFCMKMRLTI